MKTEEQVWTVLVETNPVPDVNLYGRDEDGGAAYLATLEARSSEVTQLDTKAKDSKEKKEKKKKVMAFLVAAGIIILAGVALVVYQADPTQVAGQPGSPEAVLTEYVGAYNSGDIDAVMVFFSEESVITGNEFFRSSSLNAIRLAYTQDIDAAATEDAYTISNVEVTGNTVTWDQVWIDRAGDEYCLEGQSAVIEDDKILLWTWPPGESVPCP